MQTARAATASGGRTTSEAADIAAESAPAGGARRQRDVGSSWHAARDVSVASALGLCDVRTAQAPPRGAAAEACRGGEGHSPPAGAPAALSEKACATSSVEVSAVNVCSTPSEHARHSPSSKISLRSRHRSCSALRHLAHVAM